MKNSLFFNKKLIKEKYLNKTNIDDFFNTIIDFRNKHSYSFQISNSALLILDMQNYFTNPKSHAYAPAVNEIIDKINNLISIFEFENGLILFTKHCNEKKSSNKMIDWWNDTLQENSQFSHIDNRLNIKPNNIIIHKEHYDAFSNTKLNVILKSNNIKNVFITGVMTHLCCETTARNAFINGYNVFFLIDANATYNKTFHLNTLINLSHGFAIPILFEEIINEKNL